MDGTARLWEAETCKPIGLAMKHEGIIRGAVLDQAQKRILTWSGGNLAGKNAAYLWEAETGKLLGQPMKHEDSVNGAVFDQAQKRVLTWSDDGTARLWDIPGDLDFPHEHLVLQVQALTGTKLDLQTRQISVIPTSEWQALQKQYLDIAREHAKECQYPRQNLYLWFWGKDE
jgi:WD40 repeat protein